MKKKLIKSALLLALLLALLTACSQTPQPRSAISDYDYSQMQLVQLDVLAGNFTDGQPIVTITTSMGEIKIALFPEYAPLTVENFIGRIEEAFYNESDVLAIREAVFFQAGVNSAGEAHSHIIDNEYSVNLWPFKGALAAYSQEQGVSDSRFIVIHEQERSEREREQLRELKVNGEDTLPEELLDALEEVGAAITLSGFYTIFGQAFEGFDVIEAITATEVDKESRPKTEIRIVTVEIEYYNENEGTSDEN